MRKSSIKRIIGSLAVLLLPGLLTACKTAGGEGDLPPEPEDGVLVYAALNPVDNKMQSRIDQFNETHTDVQIEVRDYADEGGPQRLLVELVAGYVPDIMELHRFGEIENTPDSIQPNVDRPEGEYWMPYRRLASMGYLEELWPYIENDPELGREALLETPMKAAEVNGGLYMVFQDVSVTTLMGEESVVGDRMGWTFEELMDTFSAMPEESTVLRYNATRWEVYSRLFCSSMNQYVNWETGECSFDSEQFRSILEFLKTLPAEFKTPLSPEEQETESIVRALEGRQMLEAVTIDAAEHVARIDVFFGPGRVSFVGYPTADGSLGSFFDIKGSVLAMSTACRNKEAAWDFMRQLIRRNYTTSTMTRLRKYGGGRIPVNRTDYETGIRVDLATKNRISGLPPLRYAYPPGYEMALRIDTPTEDDCRRFEALVDNTTQIYWPDSAISSIVWETCGPYFAGDKTMDETIRLMENRVGLYVKEIR